MEAKNNIPKRRFKEFKNADAWEQRKLGEIGTIIAGGDVDKSKLIRIGKYPVYANALTNEGIIGYYNDYYRVEAPAVTVTGRGDIGLALARKTNFTPIVRLLAITSNHNVNFLENSINKYKSIVESTGVPQLTAPQLRNYSLYFPYDESEELSIGSFFQSLDQLITLHQRKLDKLKNIKKAHLSELFPAEGEREPKRRFSGFTDAWEQRKLGHLAEIVRGASPRPIQDPKWFNNDSEIGWLRISDVTEQNGRIYHLEQKISKLGQEKTRVLNEPHLLLSIAATVGKPVINYVKTGVHDGFLIFITPKFDREFMFQWLEMFRPMWAKYGQPGSQVNLNSDLIRKHSICIPSQEEQEKIGSFFQSLDHLITLHQRKLDKLKNMKKAYLNELFV
ncbi:restriction endonuclease subunit S [Streptococcus sp. CSL7591-lung]|uniref:Restriction endonuclease subunit S n=2 Tax=Streptococcus pacificus TaxID=2740577 RepID=A0ABS0ZIR9_9STRE|nr:restriction endonuclease subunit S [Streptococcus pacificus]